MDTFRLSEMIKRYSTAMLLTLIAVAMAIPALAMAIAADTTQSPENIDEKRLVGRWIRPDGGYVIELSPPASGGTLKAAYFNPRAINVSRSEIRCKDGSCTVFLELRDVNYPGSTYSLRYDSKNDRLTGTYYQAVQKETYTVEFIRTR